MNVVYSDDTQLMNTANSYLAEYKLSISRGSSSFPPSNHRSRVNQGPFRNKSGWRKVDAVNRRFSYGEKYSGIIAESPNLSHAQNAYVTY